jgi:hypothetical protein
VTKDWKGGAGRRLCIRLNSNFITSKMLQGINESNSHSTIATPPGKIGGGEELLQASS